jgi:hypothetical protein
MSDRMAAKPSAMRALTVRPAKRVGCMNVLMVSN